jgi:hypothetical protein
MAWSSAVNKSNVHHNTHMTHLSFGHVICVSWLAGGRSCMKFRFCGDLDAPEWILSEVSVLSKMSSVRMMLVCRHIVEQLLGKGISYEKIMKLTSGERLRFGM